MFFKKENSYYRFNYSKSKKYKIYLFLDKDSINFHFLYYNESIDNHFSKTLYSFDINHTTDDNISILENLYFYLTHTPTQFEAKEHIEFSKDELNNDYIKYFNNISNSFFPTNDIENDIIKILFMSFIFELYQCDTFKDSLKYNKLKNNRVFKLFGFKLQYLLAKEIAKKTKELDNKEYLKLKEKKWINTLFSENHKIIVEYASGYELISSPEEELDSILSAQRIKELDIKKDKDLIELSSNYFLSVLNISKMFDIVTKNKSFMIIGLMTLSIFIFLGSLFIDPDYQGVIISIVPIFIIVVTIFILFALDISYIPILIMPRLFFSILISWLALVTSYDLFFAHVHHNFYNFVVINIIILTIIVSYFFIEIKNNRFKRIGSILVVSIFISLIEGIFVLKFYLQSFIIRAFTLENYNNLDINKTLIEGYRYKGSIDTHSNHYELIKNLPEHNISLDNFVLPLKGVFVVDVYVLFALIMIPVFFGLILQNIVDDKSIFKPLK